MRGRGYPMQLLLGPLISLLRLLHPPPLNPRAVPLVVLLRSRKQLSRMASRIRSVPLRGQGLRTHVLLKKNRTHLLRSDRE